MYLLGKSICSCVCVSVWGASGVVGSVCVCVCVCLGGGEYACVCVYVSEVR